MEAYILYVKDANGFDDAIEVEAHNEAGAHDIFIRLYSHKYMLDKIVPYSL